MSRLLILQYLFVLSTSVTIEFSEIRTFGFQKTYIKSESGEISPRTISQETSGIRKVEYQEGEKQISQISNLPRLNNVYMDKVKQQFLPVFFDLPSLENLSMEKNELVFVTRDRFSFTPVVYLFLRFNKILQIEDGAFGVKVKHIYLACNYLKSIRKEWFQNPALINVIDLDDNYINYIEQDTFKDFKKLEYFYILHNGLKSIGDNAFSGTSFISEFQLGFNDLTILQPEIFPETNITIELLDISFNKLTFLHKSLMDKIHLVNNPKIDGNPWQCSCYYYHIIRWVPWNYYQDRRDRPGEPRCVGYLMDFSRRCRTYVDQELMNIFSKNSSPHSSKKGDFCLSNNPDG